MPEALVQNVWVVNFNGQEIDHAKTFGAIRFVTHGRVETFRVDSLIRQVTTALKDSRPDDWVVATGHIVLGMLVALEMVRRHGRLNLLLWHARLRIYIPRIIHAHLDSDVSDPFLQSIMEGEWPNEL